MSSITTNLCASVPPSPSSLQPTTREREAGAVDALGYCIRNITCNSAEEKAVCVKAGARAAIVGALEATARDHCLE